MTRLSWGDTGYRLYEAGVDRGVLYTTNNVGVVWNGLVSVNEDPSGAEVKDYFLDGIKYLSTSSSEQFGATIEAFTYPEEFENHDGTSHVSNGLYARQQIRPSFGFSYRTKIGNDLDGSDHGYKIHLVYNATAKPSSRNNRTLGDQLEPGLFSWEVTTRAAIIQGYRPTAHFVVDSTKTPALLLEKFENLIYGTDDEAAKLPTPEQLVGLFKSGVEDTGFIDGGQSTGYYSTIYDSGTIDQPQSVVYDGGSL